MTFTYREISARAIFRRRSTQPIVLWMVAIVVEYSNGTRVCIICTRCTGSGSRSIQFSDRGCITTTSLDSEFVLVRTEALRFIRSA